MRRQIWSIAAAVALAASAGAQTEPALTSELVVDGLEKPLLVTAPAGDLERLFILEQDGRIRIVREGSLLATPFLNIEPLVGTEIIEQGLLGMAFSPDYEVDGQFYIYYTDLTDASIVARYTVSADPDVADPASAEILLTQAQPGQRHNAGWMGFGLDRMLYIALGDGGLAGSTAQDRSSLLGSILRIDVLGPPDPGLAYAIPGDNPFVGVPEARGEIWAWGLRNPWRNDIDPDTGDLWIADVGLREREELNFQPGDSAGGENYGWWCREGTLCLVTSGNCPPSCDPSLFTEPIHEYDRTVGRSITGGVVYRGCAMPELSGTYFFGDHGVASIWSLRYDGAVVTEFTDRTAELAPGGGRTIDAISSFGRDGYGEMYICDRHGGEIFRIIPRELTDCNDNGIADGCDIAVGTSLDENKDGIPDECQCRADLTGDGELDIFDFLEFQNLFAAGDLRADFTGDGVLDVFDFLQFQNEFAAGCV